MKRNLLNILLRGSYWATNAFVSAFTIVYLNRVGFSDWQIGLMISLMGIFSLTLNYVITDYCEDFINNYIKYWVIIIYLLSFVAYFMYEFLNIPLFIKMILFPLAYCLFSYNHRFVNLLCATNLDEKNIKDGNRPNNIGTLIYSITVLIVAVYFDKSPVNFLIHSTLKMIAIAILFTLFTDNLPCYTVYKLRIKDSYKIIKKVVSNKCIMFLLIAVALSSIGAIMSLKFISRVVIENNGTIFNLGIAFAIQSAIIVPISICSKKIREKFSCGKLLLANFFFSFLKILILLISNTCNQIYFAMALTALGYGGMGFATVDYLKKVASNDNYEMFHELTVICNNLNLGSLIGGISAGFIMTFYNVRSLLIVSAIISLLSFVAMLCSSFLEKRLSR